MNEDRHTTRRRISNERQLELDRYTKETDIWRDAWRIADPGAANPVAVARSLFLASSFIMSRGGTDDVKAHPALKVMAGQLSSLYNVSVLGAEDDDYTMVKSVIDNMAVGHNLGYSREIAEMEVRSRHGG